MTANHTPFSGKVRDVSSKGLGVVDSPDGRIIFVPGTWPGDEGQFEIIKMEKRFGFGRLISLTSPSLDRVEPPCPHHGIEPGQCSGCPWMMGSYKSQLTLKENSLRTALERSGLLREEVQFRPMSGSSRELGYRNRAQVKTDGQQLGFVTTGTKQLAPIDDCLVLNEPTRALLKSLISQLPNPEWKPGKNFLWSFLEFDDSMELANIKPNQHIPFRQANDEKNNTMISTCLAWAKTLDPQFSIVELFCGSGNFTQALHQAGMSSIFAAELSQQAIDELIRKDTLGVRPAVMDIFKEKSWKQIEHWNPEPHYLLLDPPRGGFPQIDKFCQMFPTLKEIMYISCDQSAFINDCKKLKALSYPLTAIQPVDQFPHTPHLEIIGWFKKT